MKENKGRGAMQRITSFNHSDLRSITSIDVICMGIKMIKIKKQGIFKRLTASLLCAVLLISLLQGITAGAAGTHTYDIVFDNPHPATLDFGRDNDQVKRGQNFIALEGGNLRWVDVKIMKQGSPADLSIELYASNDSGLPVGEVLAEAAYPAQYVPSGAANVVSIPLSYDGLNAGQTYVIVLGQEREYTSGYYTWYSSADASQENWWTKDNPQIKQQGYDEDLISIKYTESGDFLDDSRCGDLWTSIHYILDGEAEPEIPGFPQEPEPEIPLEYLEGGLADQYEKDMAEGGTSFYMDRMLARRGVDPTLIEDSGLMTRGRALYTKGTNSNELMLEFGFGGNMRYIKGDMPGYTMQINGQRASDFSEDTAKRTDMPGYWTSEYHGKDGSVNEDLDVTVRRFITDRNSAVTLLDISNTSDSAKTVQITIPTVSTCSKTDGNELTGFFQVDHRNINLKLSMDGAEAVSRTLTKTVTLEPGETITQKAQMGFLDSEYPEPTLEYNKLKAKDGEQAFLDHLKEYHYWWVENLPYLEIPDVAVQKMIVYRWWILRFNMTDAGTHNYPFPTAIEGVFGFNNAIINAIPWQMDEMRYMRTPLYEYGTWADVIFTANGGNFRDNPAGVWGNAPQQYISQAGWESYKVHGGQTSFLEAVADAGAGDVEGTREEFGLDTDYLYGIQYDAWDYDTASLSIRGTQERIDTAAFAWANANAVSEMYGAAGNNSAAQTYRTYADNIKEVNLDNAWDSETEQFLMKMHDTGEFNPFRDINNYYGFMMGMVPQNQGYEKALRVWGDANEFPLTPTYVSNSKDYNIIQNNPEYDNRSLNYSPGNIAVTLKMFGNVLKEYDASNITGESYMEILEEYTRMCYATDDLQYPDTNEFWNGDPNNSYRSWIHHNWHSQYNTLVIEDIVGVTPRDDKVVELHPIDAGYDSFRLLDIKYHDSDMSVVWDADTGYALFIDGECVAMTDKLCHYTWNSETGAVEIQDDSGAAILIQKPVDSFKTPYEISYNEGTLGKIIDSVSGYTPGDTIVDRHELPIPEAPDHDGSYKIEIKDGSAWDQDRFNLDFGENDNYQAKRAQMFMSLDDVEMTGIQVMIRNKDAEKDITVELYSSDDQGRPHQMLTSAHISIEDVPRTYMGIVTADLTYQLEKDTAYFIVLGQADGGTGLYCWSVSSPSYTDRVQGYQPGYNGELNMYMFTPAGVLVDDSVLGDNYLEVFYKSEAEDPAITVDENIENGYIVYNPKNPKTGETVTITVDPNSGYVLKDGSLKYNNTVITANESGEYTFIMPTGNVVLTAKFIADKARLQNLITACEELDKDNYTADSWANLETAISSAKVVLGNEDASATEVNTAYRALLAAKLDLVYAGEINKVYLEELIRQAKAINTAGLRPGLLSIFEEMLKEAEKVYSDGTVTQDEVNEAATNLLVSMINLKEIISKKDLEDLIDILNNLDEDNYTENSWRDLEKAIEDAQKLTDDSSQAEIDEAYDKLCDAYENLVKTMHDINKEALKNALDNGKLILDNIDDFIPSTVKGLQEIYDRAKTVYDNPDASQADVDAVTKELAEANAKARVKEDKSALEKAAKEAAALDAEKYTAASYAVLVYALEEAHKVLENDEATAEEIAAALKLIEEAMAQLKEISSGGEQTEDTSTDESDSSTNNTGNKGSGKKKNNGGKGTSSKAGAKTGDSTNTILWFMLLMTAVGTAVIIVRKRKISK